MRTSKLVGFLHLIFICCCNSGITANNTRTEEVSIPSDDFYKKMEDKYADAKLRFSGKFNFDELIRDIPEKSDGKVYTAEKLAICFKNKLPLMSKNIINFHIYPDSHAINAVYVEKLNDNFLSQLYLTIGVYRNYDQARRLVFLGFTRISQPQGWKADASDHVGDFSWSVIGESNTPSFHRKIIKSNLIIEILYQEWYDNTISEREKQSSPHRTKEEICRKIIKIIEDCQ